MDAVEVIRMGRNGWTRNAVLSAAWVGFFGWTAAAGGAPRQPVRAFDFAISEMEIRQLSSTPMFREVEVRCVVTNRGPHTSSGPVSIVVSRFGDDGLKVLKKIGLPESLPPGGTFV